MASQTQNRLSRYRSSRHHHDDYNNYSYHYYYSSSSNGGFTTTTTTLQTSPASGTAASVARGCSIAIDHAIMADVESPVARDTSSYPRSLFDVVRNGWKTDPKGEKPHRSCRPLWARNLPSWVSFVLAVVTAPRFRRYIIVYMVLLCMCYGTWVGLAAPWLKEHEQLMKALDTNNRDRVGGWFGANALPKFSGMVHIRSLDPALLPGAEGAAKRRLVVIGDVHGCNDELEKLLQKISFDRRKGDHLIFTGDLITKGPKSVEVVQLARKYHASCVRGNHEDRVLLVRRELKAAAESGSSGALDRSDSTGEDRSTRHDSRERDLAQQLSDEDAEWLDTCPVILKVGHIPTMGEVVVVHAGLVPGVLPENQDPYTVMTMRTIDLDTHVPSSSPGGMNWAKVFNKYQRVQAISQKAVSPVADGPASPLPTTVIYGHDFHRSPALKAYTKGLDTGCVQGGKLTALIIKDGGEMRIEQVRCADYMDRSKRWLPSFLSWS
ncbi:hypothetical protein VTO42DRAFT_5554 [Malbranchea cinnamomea]